MRTGGWRVEVVRCRTRGGDSTEAAVAVEEGEGRVREMAIADPV